MEQVAVKSFFIKRADKLLENEMYEPAKLQD